MFDINNRRVSVHNFSKSFRECYERTFLRRYFSASRENLSLKWNECELRIVCMRWQTIIGDGVYFYNFFFFSIISSFLIGVRNPDCWWAMTARLMKKAARTHTHRRHDSHDEDNDRVASHTHPVRLASNRTPFDFWFVTLNCVIFALINDLLIRTKFYACSTDRWAQKRCVHVVVFFFVIFVRFVCLIPNS